MSPRPVATPAAEEVRAAFALVGSTRLAAPLLGINYRTLERRMAADAGLKLAADQGRKHYAENVKPSPHGTQSRYDWERRHGLSTCDECRAANAASRRQWYRDHQAVAA